MQGRWWYLIFCNVLRLFPHYNNKKLSCSLLQKIIRKKNYLCVLKNKEDEETEFCKTLGKTHVLPVGIDRHRRIDPAVV